MHRTMHEPGPGGAIARSARVAGGVTVTVGAVVATMLAGVPASASAATASQPVGCSYVAAVGVPGEDLGSPSRADAGMVELRGDDGGQAVHAPDYAAGDRFGTAITTTDLDGDDCQDLVVGAPGRAVDGVTGAGAVYVYRGTPQGPRLARTLVQGSDGVPGQPQENGHFGAVLAGVLAGSETGATLRIGQPDRDVDGAKDAGAVIRLEAGGLLGDGAVDGDLLTLGSGGLPASPEAGDRFGAALTDGAYEAIGIPGRTVDGQAEAGAALRRHPDSKEWELLSQNSPGVPGTAEAGDHFGAAVAAGVSLAVGVPGEDIGDLADAGMVNTFPWSDGEQTPESITQDSIARDGGPKVGNEAGDRFGAAMSTWTVEQFDDDGLYVGAPGEDLGSTKDAGLVLVRGEMGKWSMIAQGDGAGRAEADDQLGATISRANVTDVPSAGAFGAPGEDSGAGSVLVVDGYGKRMLWKQTTGAPEAGDGYGAALSSGGR